MGRNQNTVINMGQIWGSSFPRIETFNLALKEFDRLWSKSLSPFPLYAISKGIAKDFSIYALNMTLDKFDFLFNSHSAPNIFHIETFPRS